MLFHSDKNTQFPSQSSLLHHLCIQFVYDYLTRLPQWLSGNSKEIKPSRNQHKVMPLSYNIVFILTRINVCINKEQYKLWSSDKISKRGSGRNFILWSRRTRRTTRHMTGCRNIRALLPVIWQAAVIFARYSKTSFIGCILNHRKQVLIPSILMLRVRFCDIFISSTFNPSSTSVRTSQST
jgi:hypothetical protein